MEFLKVIMVLSVLFLCGQSTGHPISLPNRGPEERVNGLPGQREREVEQD